MIPGSKRRRRIKPGNVTTADDVKLFQTLAKRAKAVAAHPLGDAVGFVQCAEKAFAAVPPPGHRDPDSAFVKLVRLGKRFLLLTSIQRQEQVADLTAWAAAIDEALIDAPASPTAGALRSPPAYRAPYAENDR